MAPVDTDEQRLTGATATSDDGTVVKLRKRWASAASPAGADKV